MPGYVNDAVLGFEDYAEAETDGLDVSSILQVEEEVNNDCDNHDFEASIPDKTSPNAGINIAAQTTLLIVRKRSSHRTPSTSTSHGMALHDLLQLRIAQDRQ